MNSATEAVPITRKLLLSVLKAESANVTTTDASNNVSKNSKSGGGTGGTDESQIRHALSVLAQHPFLIFKHRALYLGAVLALQVLCLHLEIDIAILALSFLRLALLILW
jgi:hypothetical protein